MSRDGNMWMMRRTHRSYYVINYIDKDEYRKATIAKSYYLKAEQYAQTDKFKALCLRLAARCEDNRIEWEEIHHYKYEQHDSIYATNKYLQKLKTQYPEYYRDLMPNCYNFNEYFKSRR